MYIRSKAHSEAQSEISAVLHDPIRKMEERWECWFSKLTSTQQQFVLEENSKPDSPGFGPDHPLPSWD